MTAGDGAAAHRQPSGSPRRRRLLDELRSPAGLRRALLGKEILDPPVALRELPGAFRRRVG